MSLASVSYDTKSGNNDDDESSSCTSSEDDENSNYIDSGTEKSGTPIIKGMSMEELLAIQEEIGTKEFSKKIKRERSIKKKQIDGSRNFKRANKNRPRELPLQRKPAPKMKFVDPKIESTVKSTISRDPRFDDLSGKLDIVAWKKNYRFLANKRKKEVKLLKNELEVEKDGDRVEQIKMTIQRMENQERERKKLYKEREFKKQQREVAIASLKEGKAPKYISRKERTLAMKVSHFDTLKKENKVEKYLRRKEKKMRRKEF